MKQILLAVWIILWLGLLFGVVHPALAQGCGPSNPNCVVPNRPVGDSTNAAANTRFVQLNGPFVNVEAYGAISGPGNATVNTAAIQAAINAVTSGGTVFFPHFRYNINGSLTTTKPITFLCGSKYSDATGGNINATTNDPVFVVNSNDVTARDCYLQRAGGVFTGTAFIVGNDAVTVSDAICTNTSGTVTSASNGFASAVAGMFISLPNCASGPVTLFTTISTVAIGGGSITIANLATATPGVGVSAKFGNIYTRTLIDNVDAVSFGTGVQFVNAAEWGIRNGLLSANIPVDIEDQLNPDFGTSSIVGTYLKAPDTVSGHYALRWRSGGDLFLGATKLFGGQYGLYQNWNAGVSGNLMMVGGSIEGCGTNALFFSPAVQFNNVSVTGVDIGCGTTPIVFDNSSASIINVASLNGNIIIGTSIFGIDAGKVTGLSAVGNPITGGNPAINIRSNCTSCSFSGNGIVGAIQTYANASTTTLIDDMNGTTFANLPTAAANGSRIFVSDADPATSPCTSVGTKTGATAIRQNGAWKCL